MPMPGELAVHAHEHILTGAGEVPELAGTRAGAWVLHRVAALELFQRRDCGAPHLLV